MKVARLHMQVANVRRDAHNKAAHAIPDKRPSVLVIEELNVKGMVKNRRLARALSDAARHVRPDNGQRSERRHPSETYREFHGNERLWRACTSWRHRSGCGR
jgi:hypothetical protein